MWEERERSELAMEQLASQLGATQVGEDPNTRGGDTIPFPLSSPAWR